MYVCYIDIKKVMWSMYLKFSWTDKLCSWIVDMESGFQHVATVAKVEECIIITPDKTLG